MADWHDELMGYTISVCTKAEEFCAMKAYKFLHTSGYPSMAKAIHLVEDGYW